MAAPSPNTMPLRFFEKGLHEADGCTTSMLASVCSASHAFIEPNESGTSDPPAMAISRLPLATRSHASPMATAEEEQAVEYVKLGPSSLFSMAIQAALALCIPIKT